MSKNVSPLNYYVQPINKSRCQCGQPAYEVFSIGNYQHGVYHVADHFCKGCFPAVQGQLRARGQRLGRPIVINPRRGYGIPKWIEPLPIEKKEAVPA